MFSGADWGVLGKCLSVCLHHDDNLLKVSCWYFSMVTSCHCYIVSILALLTHIPHNSVEEDHGKHEIYSILTYCRLLNWKAIFVLNMCMSLSPPLSDGGVWQSSLQKAPFPSGSVDQLAQETLCQAWGTLAQRYLCQVSLKFSYFLSPVLLLCHAYLFSGYATFQAIIV